MLNYFADHQAHTDLILRPLRSEGILTTEHPSVGLLIRSEPGKLPRALCSGTLIDATTFVTAAHCVLERDRDYWVYLHNVGVVKVAAGGISAYCDAGEPGVDSC